MDEDTGNEEVDAKNKEVNREKKKYRDRFKVFLTKLVPTCIHPHGWTSQLQTQHGISDYVDKDGQAMVPPAVEAMVIVLVENNQDGWELINRRNYQHSPLPASTTTGQRRQ